MTTFQSYLMIDKATCIAFQNSGTIRTEIVIAKIVAHLRGIQNAP
jgi:hypothetical protein